MILELRIAAALSAALILAGVAAASAAEYIRNPTVVPRQAPADADVILYDPTKIIVRFRQGADPGAVMGAALADNRESFTAGGSIAMTQGAVAATIDFSGAMPRRESTGSLFAVERLDQRESASVSTLDAVIARLNADPRVEYAEKDYLRQHDQATDFVNQILRGATGESVGDVPRSAPPAPPPAAAQTWQPAPQAAQSAPPPVWQAAPPIAPTHSAPPVVQSAPQSAQPAGAQAWQPAPQPTTTLTLPGWQPTPQAVPPATPSQTTIRLDMGATSASIMPDDPLFIFQWHLWARGDAITASTAPGAANFPALWDGFRARRTVVVAVLDTGQVFNHEDLPRGVLLPGYDFVSNAEHAKDGDGRDPDPTDPGDGRPAGFCSTGSPAREDSWHGAHVSGIAGGAQSFNRNGMAAPIPAGIAILPVRVLGACGGVDSDIVDAIVWAAGGDVPNVPRNPNPASVINLSLSGPGRSCSPLYRAAIDVARGLGAVVVVAAGNQQRDAAGRTPANCADAVTVAASDINGRLAYYSNFGSAVDILAPGGDRTADLDKNELSDGILSFSGDFYDLKQGTSMSAPLVSAAIAIALAHDPSLTGDEAVARLIAGAVPRTAEHCPKGCGAGLLDVAAIVR